MEVLLLITVLAVGASALFVAATFNKRTRQNASPMIEACVRRFSKVIEDDSKDLKKQLQGLAAEVARDRKLAEARNTALQESFGEVGRMLSAIAGQLAEDSEVIKHLKGQVPGNHEQLRSDTRELDRRITELGESLTQQYSQGAAGINESLNNKARLSGASLTELNQSIQAVSRSHSRAEDQLAAIIRVLDQHMEQSNRAERHDSWAAGQIAAAAAQAQMLADGQISIGSYLRAGLDYTEVKSSHDNGCRIIAVGLNLSGPGSDIMWQLLLSFCRAIRLRNLSPGQPTGTGSRSYFLWQSQSGRQLEEALNAGLTGVREGDPRPHAPGQDGLAELRSLLIALHISGPGTIQLGPLILNRTPGALLGYVMTAAEAWRISAAGTVATPGRFEAALREVGQDRLSDLTSWADSVTLNGDPAETPGRAG